VEAALKLATGVPLRVAEKSREVARIAQALYAISNPNMKSDLTTAEALAGAAVTGALANVEINLASLKDPSFAAGVRERVKIIQG
jgi:formiminotetrahydrofolate cyclodeaminase